MVNCVKEAVNEFHARISTTRLRSTPIRGEGRPPLKKILTRPRFVIEESNYRSRERISTTSPFLRGWEGTVRRAPPTFFPEIRPLFQDLPSLFVDRLSISQEDFDDSFSRAVAKQRFIGLPVWKKKQLLVGLAEGWEGTRRLFETRYFARPVGGRSPGGTFNIERTR